MLERGCAGGDLRHSAKSLASRCYALRSPAKADAQKSPERRRSKVRKSQTRWYVKQPTLRKWGEEQVEGAVYTVLLKKVAYHTPTRSVSSDPDDERSHLTWETVRVRSIKAGTLARLVEALVSDDGELESSHVNVFLATYRSFAESSQVLDLLMRRYQTLANDLCTDTSIQHQKSLVACLHVWLDTYPEDFRQPPHHPTLHNLQIFTQIHLPDTELLAKVQHRLALYKAEHNGSCRVGGGIELLSLEAGLRLSLHHTRHYRLPHVDPQLFAQQLTRKDVVLFRRVLLPQCLGSTWKHEKQRERIAPTPLATINQFNAVTQRVISTVLMEPHMRPTDRATIIAVWLDIAAELRMLKNFSSLKAIVASLKVNPIWRLRKTWALLDKDHMELFESLDRICSEENNRQKQRELLELEGTSKYPFTVDKNDKQLQRLIERGQPSANHGFIPFMGTFLTDLLYIDTANDDTIDGLINFEKRRKEFEVLAKIKLLQGAASNYNIQTDPVFDAWFASVVVLTEAEQDRLSYEIEDESERRISNGRHRKNDSIASTSSSSGSQPYCHEVTDGVCKPDSPGQGSKTPSEVSLDSGKVNGKPPSSPARQHAPLGGGSDFYIVGVRDESSDCPETAGKVLYKSIRVMNHERTQTVIRNAMQKLDLEGPTDSYTLSQILSDREIVLPDDANVFYAVKPSKDELIQLILRRKQKHKGYHNGRDVFRDKYEHYTYK